MIEICGLYFHSRVFVKLSPLRNLSIQEEIHIELMAKIFLHERNFIVCQRFSRTYVQISFCAPNLLKIVYMGFWFIIIIFFFLYYLWDESSLLSQKKILVQHERRFVWNVVTTPRLYFVEKGIWLLGVFWFRFDSQFVEKSSM